ncbi:MULTISPECIES: ankyrin repeat domain-containing protein [Brevibacterium]|uniref:ankyrin repeat domain-containing protein n=1 Tax=Brevibacterium TaxID=1696 RepID=UPI00191ABF47|nr:ankyrin repeat domain-containing protein [Brevibacterium casei]QQT68029.1 ankyrin repeat domain-containing protein [Brevibacterium casei]
MAEKLLTLPKNFRKYGKAYSLFELRDIFQERSLDARGGKDEEVALAFSTVDGEGVRWLIDLGADVEAESRFGKSPLAARAGAGDVEAVRVLLELGADPIRAGSKYTPLCAAAPNHRLEVVRLLLDAGADQSDTNVYGWTALDLAAIRSEPDKVERGLPVVKLLVERGGTLSKDAVPYLRDAMATLYRYQTAGNARIQQVIAMTEMLEMLGIELPVRPRVLGADELITVTTEGWKKQYSELWGLLVPGRGPAASIQGEVIRIAGRIGHELLDNGGGNWDRDFEMMAAAFGRYVRTGAPLDGAGLRRVDNAVTEITGGQFAPDAVDTLTEQAVAWVLANPERFGTGDVDYKR